MDYSHFQNLSLPIFQIIIFALLVILKIFWAKKIKKNQLQQVFEKIYLGHNKGESFEKLGIDKDLKLALEKYFYGWEKSQKQKIFSLWQKK